MTHSLALVYTAVDQVNAQIVNGPRIVKAPDTLLLDAEGGVDSLALVNLIAALEQLVLDETGKTIVIADETIYSAPTNPLRSLGTLAAYIDTLVS
jgi:acyl carrier protein